jgi:hypothetical protein
LGELVSVADFVFLKEFILCVCMISIFGNEEEILNEGYDILIIIISDGYPNIS